MSTHTETILQYRILRHDDLPQAHKDEMIKHGINPDEQWNLIYSFDNKADAYGCLEEEEFNAAPWETYKLKDAGEATTIERSDWF